MSPSYWLCPYVTQNAVAQWRLTAYLRVSPDPHEKGEGFLDRLTLLA